jgi:hypothetical protein
VWRYALPTSAASGYCVGLVTPAILAGRGFCLSAEVVNWRRIYGARY